MYQVIFVREDALPAGVDWALAQTDDGQTYLFIKRDAVSPRVLTEAWAGYRHLAGHSTAEPAA